MCYSDLMWDKKKGNNLGLACGKLYKLKQEIKQKGYKGCVGPLYNLYVFFSGSPVDSDRLLQVRFWMIRSSPHNPQMYWNHQELLQQRKKSIPNICSVLIILLLKIKVFPRLYIYQNKGSLDFLGAPCHKTSLLSVMWQKIHLPCCFN